jgi:alanine-glyoxylate transaminase/serine-glyoxylate transaminase/serine-pyruvate transaminase
VLAAGLADLGLELAVAEAWRLPQLNAVTIPEGKDDAATRSRLLTDFNLEVGAGLGELAGKQWRIGLMGSSSHAVNINRCLSAFEAVLSS